MSEAAAAMSEAAAMMGREGARPLGAQFAAAREKRGLSPEQVSSETHIRVQRLREIERDDYSQFPDPSYARMYAIDYAKYLGIPISQVQRLLPEPGVSGAGGYQYLQATRCDYVRTNLGSGRPRRLLPKLVTCALLVLFSLGGFKLSMILRDIERLGLDRMAREDKAALAVPETPNAVPATFVTPESASDPVGVKHEETEVPAAAIPVHRAMPSDAESALLVGADLDHSNRIW
jgi:transcriptional regulator with XRE-family HTH domain